MVGFFLNDGCVDGHVNKKKKKKINNRPYFIFIGGCIVTRPNEIDCGNNKRIIFFESDGRELEMFRHLKNLRHNIGWR